MGKLRTVGGFLQIILASICLLFGVLATAILLLDWRISFTIPEFQLQSTVGIVGLIAFAFGLAGAIFTFKKTRFLLPIIGDFIILIWSILLTQLALISPGSFERLTGLMFGMFMSIFSILSLIFITISRKDFTHT